MPTRKITSDPSPAEAQTDQIPEALRPNSTLASRAQARQKRVDRAAENKAIRSETTK